MGNKLITFRHLINDVATNVTSVVFSDPTAAYGLRRTDTPAVVTPPAVGTAIPNVSTGVYQYQLMDLLEGVPYEYWITWVYNAVTHRTSRTFVGPSDDYGQAQSPFFTYDQFVRRWGLKNIRIASNKNNESTTVDMDSVQESFLFATSEIYQALSGGPYAIPLEWTPNDGLIPGTVQRWAMVIAYADLYDARGMEEKDKARNKIGTLLTSVYADMAMHKALVKQLPASLATDVTAEASAVSYSDIMRARNECVVADGVPIWS